MLYYVCSPYSKYERGIQNAFEDAAKACGELTRRGISVFSPIVHSHPIAIHGHVDPYDHKLWLALDSYMIEAASGCIVVMMPGWAESHGVEIEIAEFKKSRKADTMVFMAGTCGSASQMSGTIAYIVQANKDAPLYLAVMDGEREQFHTFPLSIQNAARLAAECGAVLNVALGAVSGPDTAHEIAGVLSQLMREPT